MTLETLRQSHQALLDHYHEHGQFIRNFQRDFVQSSSKEEEGNFVMDTGSLFRLLKRDKYALDGFSSSVSSTLVWRARNKLHLQFSSTLPNVLFSILPTTARDRLNRPIVLVQLSKVNEYQEGLKDAILRSFECLRRDMQHLNEETNEEGVFQCLWIVDIENVGAKLAGMAAEILPWMLKDLKPHYHGLSAAVCIVNYSWVDSGIWNVVKRILPQSTLDKILFTSQSQLLEIIERGSLPREYGGELTMPDSPSSLPSHPHLSPPPQTMTIQQTPTPPSTPPPSPPPPLSQRPKRFSLQSPFFGYPTTAEQRRRSSDLIVTLLLLYYFRWKKHLMFILTLLVGWAVWKVRLRRRGWKVSSLLQLITKKK